MPGGRPKGARSYATKNVRALLDRLQREGKLQPERVFARLQEIALSDADDRIGAARLLLGYHFGYPAAKVDFDVQHSLGESATGLLLRIASSDAHRAALEDLERDRRRLPAVTVEP